MSFNPNQHLARQVGYLQRSCHLFDEGHTEEAVRIAGVLRTIFHQTAKSTSLLTHLRQIDIQLLSTVEMIDTSNILQMTGGLFITAVSSRGCEYRAPLEASRYREEAPFEQWWNQVVYIQYPYRVTRAHLIKDAANTDGGAHIDDKQKERYRAVKDYQFGVYVEQEDNVHLVDVARDAHYVMLRKIGYEVLESHELMRLASTP